MMPGIAGELKTLQLLLVEDDRDDEFLARLARPAIRAACPC